MNRRKSLKLGAGLGLAALLPRTLSAQGTHPVTPKNKLGLEVDYVVTPEEIVDAMLQLADVKKTDVVYDLGCGDGRIVIAAAKKFGARGVGVDIDPDRIKEANAAAKKAGVEKQVKFILGDLFEADFRDATVVALFLKWNYNRKLRPRLWEQLKPGTPVVSHEHDFGSDWLPSKQTVVSGKTVYLYTVPGKK